MNPVVAEPTNANIFICFVKKETNKSDTIQPLIIKVRNAKIDLPSEEDQSFPMNRVREVTGIEAMESGVTAYTVDIPLKAIWPSYPHPVKKPKDVFYFLVDSVDDVTDKRVGNYIYRIGHNIADMPISRDTSIQFPLVDVDLIPLVEKALLSNGYKCVVEAEHTLIISRWSTISFSLK